MNDTEREQWVDNDEGLYNWKREWARHQPRRQPRSTRAFVRANRDEIDAIINRVTTGQKPAHYLAY